MTHVIFSPLISAYDRTERRSWPRPERWRCRSGAIGRGDARAASP